MNKKHEADVQRSRKAYKDHHLIESNERHWIIARKYEDGSLNSTYYTEIWCPKYPQIVVTGDIGPVTFTGGPHDVFDRILWMGTSDSWGYIAEKANMRDGNIYEFDEDHAVEWLEGLCKEQEGFPAWEDIENDFRALDTEQEFIDRMYDIVPEDQHVYDFMPVPKVIATKVYYAHAALRRLLQLGRARRCVSGDYSENRKSEKQYE